MTPASQSLAWGNSYGDSLSVLAFVTPSSIHSQSLACRQHPAFAFLNVYLKPCFISRFLFYPSYLHSHFFLLSPHNFRPNATLIDKMDDQVIQFAEQHYIAEQTARHIRIWGNQDQRKFFCLKWYNKRVIFTPALLVPPCPNFKEIWSSIAPTLRQPYVERVRALASSATPTGAQAQYRDILKTLYEKCYAEMTQSVAEETWFVPRKYSLCLCIEWLLTTPSKSIWAEYRSTRDTCLVWIIPVSRYPGWWK